MLLIFRYSAQILLENALFCRQNARLKNRLFCSKFCQQNLSKPSWQTQWREKKLYRTLRQEKVGREERIILAEVKKKLIQTSDRSK